MSTIERSFEVSPMQHGMLFHRIAAEDPGVDLVQIVCTLNERLDVPTFRRAWERVVQRHEVLRASFRWDEGEPRQDVHERVRIPFETQDWSEVSGDALDRKMQAFLYADRMKGFDLSEAPLLRLTLFTTGDCSYRLVWTYHHILIDQRAASLVLGEVFNFYEAFLQGEDPEIPLPPPFSDHVQWLERRDRSPEEGFWKELLADFSVPTPLPGARRVQAEVEGTRGELALVIPSAVTAGLHELARKADVTLNTLVQAAWALVLHRYSGEPGVVFGAARACQHTVEGAESIIGLLLNAVPVALQVPPGASLIDWLQELRRQHVAVRPHEHTPLVDIRGWCGVRGQTPLFESVVIFNRSTLDTRLQGKVHNWANRSVEPFGQTNFPIALYVYGEPELEFRAVYDRRYYDAESLERVLGGLQTILQSMAADPDASLRDLPILTDAERELQLQQWNATETETPRDALIHGLIEEQVDRTPDRVAAVYENEELSYRELNSRANRLARHLQELGVGPDVLVGICLERSLDMLVGLLAILKAGGAYVPLDPKFPKERLTFMLEDAEVSVLLTESQLVDGLPKQQAKVVTLDGSWDGAAREDSNLPACAKPNHLAYVIYTSGSTGKPKGVMVEHRNVVNFFTGMDERVEHESDRVWLAVTSLSFDISVLELFWTLARGFTVVIQGEAPHAVTPASSSTSDRPLDFSLMYFGNDGAEKGRQKYELLLEGAKFADRHGFSAVWSPERHFHAFGGLYPNPSVTSAAIAAVTERVQIRSGSVVVPLHDPIRIAEEWSFVDNLSNGRVGISVAPGWQPNDFVLAPNNYADRKEIMLRDLETVRKLWRGEKVELSNGNGDRVEVQTLPRPVQAELPVWITTSGSEETYRAAAKAGAYVLTHLLGQTIKEVGEKIRVYREVWKECGHPGEGHVTLMVHSFVGEDDEQVKELVREPMKKYLATSASLIKGFADIWSAFKRGPSAGSQSVDDLSPEEMDELLEFGFGRYFQTSGLFGSPQTCLRIIDQMKSSGVDEVACLIDFGVDSETVLSHLEHLNRLRELANASQSDSAEAFDIAEQIESRQVTHIQCTPSMARMLTMDESTRRSLRSVRHLLIGGEPLPFDLVEELRQLSSANIVNMYGPTETTIWSSTWVPDDETSPVPIGRPIANTDLYVLDPQLNPVPVGVAGELFIGGFGVVRGYLNRPELTEERFIPHPFREGFDARLYRTGDLVRYREDGVLEFIGRADHQVKIRGHRIELGEIEAILQQHDAVREAVVVAREYGPADVRLVAYVVARDGAASDALRDYLRDKLPEYMVPAIFVPMDALPLTPNRKVDRKALPAPTDVAVDEGREFQAPATALEKTLARVWEKVLGADRIGLQDNFFDLGGHSLLGIRMLAEVRRELGAAPRPGRLFQDPTLSGFCHAVEEALHGQASAAQPARSSVVDPSTLPDEIRPSHGQEAIWYIEKTRQAPAAYHIGTARRIRGRFDSASFEAAAQRLVDAHEVLRFRFPEKDGLPVLTVVDELDAVLIHEEAPSDPELLEARLKDFIADPYELSEGPLSRFGIFRLSEVEHVVVLAIHHIIGDGISLDVFWDELLRTYQTLVEGGSPSRPRPNAEYRAWAMRQRERFQDESDEGIEFWRQELADCPKPSELHPDRPASIVEARSGRSFRVQIPGTLFEAVNKLTREGITPFNAILSSLQLALARHTGVWDVAVGAIARIAPEELRGETDPAGLYINSVVVQQVLSPEKSFQDLLLANREAIGRAMDHSDVPFSRLVEALKPERGRSGGSPFFQVVLAGGPHGDRGGLDALTDAVVEPLRVEHTGAQAELALYLSWAKGAAHIDVDYVSDLFDMETIEHFVASMLSLLRHGLAQRQLPSSALETVLEPVRRSLTEERNDTARQLDAPQLLARIEQLAQEDPERVALVFEDRTLSYGQLWEASGHLAQHLISEGVRRGSMVGVSMERSAEMLQALLGIWRAGAAYLPLDPEFPEERLAFMVQDSGASYIVTDDEASVPDTQARLIDIGAVPSADEPQLPEIEGADLAYVIYTSGSTGRPKGVEVAHENIANFIESMSREPGLDEDAVLCAVTTLSFDIAGLELWLPLWVGARVVLADEDQSRDGEWLRELLESSGATVMQATPSTWWMLLNAGWEGRLDKALCGGEAFPQDLVGPLLERADEVWNLYGPTETTVWSTAYRVTRDAKGSVPIGRPIDNTRVYVVDAHGSLLPPGAPGELWIGGLGVTRGYHERSELTEERFISNPFVEGDRVYRTGDLVRWRSDGMLEHLGRMDQQVKVHGFRIELGEVEAALAGHEAVRQAVATVHGEGQDARLIGYVVLEKGADVLGSELRASLRTRLPDYMVPGLITEIDELPLTPNGKVDRKALPSLVESTARREFVPPQTAIEKQIAEIWCRLLETDKVGLHDNFFELGGHSLLAVQAVSLMSTETGHRIDPRSVFFQSLGQLASSLEARPQ